MPMPKVWASPSHLFFSLHISLSPSGKHNPAFKQSKNSLLNFLVISQDVHLSNIHKNNQPYHFHNQYMGMK
jgi:hypothetical protein